MGLYCFSICSDRVQMLQKDLGLSFSHLEPGYIHPWVESVEQIDGEVFEMVSVVLKASSLFFCGWLGAVFPSQESCHQVSTFPYPIDMSPVYPGAIPASSLTDGTGRQFHTGSLPVISGRYLPSILLGRTYLAR